MKNEVTDYRQYLRAILIEKKKSNPQSSLRSFSRVLGVQPAFLSYVLNGKRNLSDEMVDQFIDKLKLTSKEAKIFELLVKLEKTKNVPLKNKILENLKLVDPARSSQRDLSIEHFTMIAEWYHYAIFMLMDIEDFEWTPQNVATAVGVSVFEVKEALERLKALELINYKGAERPLKLEKRILAQSKIPNEAIRRYQTQMLKMTTEALSLYAPTERFHGSEVIVLSSDQLSEANEIFEECYRKIFSLSNKKTKNRRVYQVGIQLFPISKPQKKGVRK